MADDDTRWSVQNISDAKLNALAFFAYTNLAAFPASNMEVGAKGIAEDTGIIYQNNGTYETPIWTTRAASGVKPYLKLSTTIGDYTSPNAAVASSSDTALSKWGTSANQPIEDLTTFTSQADMDAKWISSDTAKYRANYINKNIDFNALSDQTDNRIYFDLGAGNISDTYFKLRFKLNVTAFTQGAEVQHLVWSIALTSAATNASTSIDSIGLVHASNSGVNYYIPNHGDGATQDRIGDETLFSHVPKVETIWVEIIRSSATAYSVEFFSNSTYTTSIERETATVPATITGLRYLQMTSEFADQVAGTARWEGTIDDIELFNLNTNTPQSIFDNNVATAWRSTSEANPFIYVDLSGSAREIVGIALNIDKTATTVTSLSIRVSTDTTFTSPENIAYVNISDFTDDTWRFLANNFLLVNARYVQIYANETGILAINEIKVRYGVTDLVKILTHEHGTRLVDSADSFNDSN